MKNFVTAMGILVFGTLLAIAVGISKPDPEKLEDTLPPAITVKVIEPQPEEKAVKVKTHGIIEASHQIELLAKVSGEVIAVSPDFVNGGEIPAGNMIVEISPVHYLTQLALAQARLKKAEQEYASEKALANQVKKEWSDRGSQEANALFLRKPQLASALAQLEATRAEVQQAQYELEQTKVRLRFDARIVDTSVNIGQYVNEGAKIATIYHTNKMQVSLPLSQSQLAKLNLEWPLNNPDQLPKIQLKAQIGKFDYELTATPRFSSSVVDAANQTVSLIADVSAENSAALPGTYVEAFITGKPRQQVYTVPEDAFHDKRYLLVTSPNNTIEFVEARFLAREGNRLLLEADINEQQLIIVDRVPLASPGMKVKPIKADSTIVTKGE